VEPDLEDTVVPREAPPPGAAPVEAPPAEPQRYGFRVGGSRRTVLLDTAAYVGRAPVAPRIQHGSRPRLIRVPSPLGEVSSTHLEVRQHGTSVVVTDLRSTNGSRVAVPGRSPRALRQGESMVVTPGTLVDIGDGIVIEILPLQRRLGGPHV
jgi:pSer/pThr/pTyr-binding forkhead associated (FHA) protein